MENLKFQIGRFIQGEYEYPDEAVIEDTTALRIPKEIEPETDSEIQKNPKFENENFDQKTQNFENQEIQNIQSPPPEPIVEDKEIKADLDSFFNN